MSRPDRDADPEWAAMPTVMRLLLALYPRDYRAWYGEEMLAVSRERAGQHRWPGVSDLLDLLLAAVKVRLHRLRSAESLQLRRSLAIVGVLAPILLLTGLDRDLHEVAWFIWYGGFTGLPWLSAATTAPVWLLWGVVAVFALLGWRRTAAATAWLATAGMLVALAVGAMLPSPLTGAGCCSR